ncbi:helix-turn-helix domain-containing protein [Cupriavidus sp. TMH.W2]|uniref:helix-turn-helix domain-containing protein n=1 Tax=Cupriavidus sp. TMH.W2 TaxID=3434465 RepID=UPI003D77BD9F
MAIDAQSQRSTKILINLSAGLDENGRPYSDGAVKLNSNLRLAASAGAAALSQLQGEPLPGAVAVGSSGIDVPEQRKLAPAPAAEQELPTPVQWLDRLKAAKGFHADITLAEYLHASKHLFSQWRTGKTALTVDEAWRVGLELGANPLLVIASVAYHSGVPEKRQVWLDLAGTLSSKSSASEEAFEVADPTSSASSDAQAAPPAAHKAAGEKPPGLESQGAKWLPEEDEKLVAEYKALMSVSDIALVHRRSIAAILYRLYKNHDLIPNDVMQALCERYNVKFNPKVQTVHPGGKSSQKDRAAGGEVFL